MNIVILTTSYTKGGAEKHALLLARYLHKETDHNVSFWVFRKGSGELEEELSQYLISSEIISKNISNSGAILPVKTIRAGMVFRRRSIDIVISFNLEANHFAAKVKKYGGYRLIWSQQTSNDIHMLKATNYSFVSNADLYISNSQHAAQYLIDEFGIPSSKAVFVPNGFDEEKDGNVDREALKIDVDSTKFNVVMVAHVEERKDHKTLLDAWAIFIKKFPDAHLYIAGKNDSTFGRNVLEYAEDVCAPHTVSFLGAVENISSLLGQCSAFAFSSNIEGMPNAIVEAMFAKLPIVANNIEGNVEALGARAIEEQVCPSRDAKRFADLLLQIAKDPTLAGKLGNENYDYAKKTFGINIMGEKTMAAINDLLSHEK